MQVEIDFVLFVKFLAILAEKVKVLFFTSIRIPFDDLIPSGRNQSPSSKIDVRVITQRSENNKCFCKMFADE